MSFILLLLFVLHIAKAAVVFDDSFIISNSDFTAVAGQPKTFTRHVDAGTGYLLYAVSAGTDAFNKAVFFESYDPDHAETALKRSLDFLITPTDGHLTPLKIPADHTQFVINTGSTDDLPAIVFYFVKLSENQQGIPPPVFDATFDTKAVASEDPAFRPAATFLSAAPRFSLVSFNIGLAGGVDVYPAGWDAVIMSSVRVERVLMIADKETARKSFVTITGPIATVVFTKQRPGRFAIAVQPNKLITDFQPGAQFAIPSPGFISSARPEKYETFADEFHLVYSSNALVDVDVRTQVNQPRWNLEVKALAGGNVIYDRVATSFAEAKVSGADEIKVDYTPPIQHYEIVVFLLSFYTKDITATTPTSPHSNPPSLSSTDRSTSSPSGSSPGVDGATSTEPPTTTSHGSMPSLSSVILTSFLFRMLL